MNLYRIINSTSGLDLGNYGGRDERAAARAMYRDGGTTAPAAAALLDTTVDALFSDLVFVPLERCAYCGAPVEVVDVPPEADDAAWLSLAPEHMPCCEWITTRAHTRLCVT